MRFQWGRRKPMSRKERKLLEELRGKVARKEISVEEGHRIWNKKAVSLDKNSSVKDEKHE